VKSWVKGGSDPQEMAIEGSLDDGGQKRGWKASRKLNLSLTGYVSMEKCIK